MYEFQQCFAIFSFSKAHLLFDLLPNKNQITHEDTTHVVYVVSVASAHQYDIHLDNDNKNHNVFHPFELDVRRWHFLGQFPKTSR